MKNKNILIIVSGSIAAYKTCDVVRLLRKEGADVQVMMTNSAEKFVGKASFAALTGEGGEDAPRLALELIRHIDADVSDELLVDTLLAS